MNTTAIVSFPLLTVARIIKGQARKVQEKCLRARKELFYDSERGFDHNIGGVRTKASVKIAEARVDNLTGGLVRFKFRSHRLLWFSICGLEKRYILDCANKYDYATKDSDETNPYLNIEEELLNAASDLMRIDRVYNELFKAA